MKQVFGVWMECDDVELHLPSSVRKTANLDVAFYQITFPVVKLGNQSFKV